MFDLEEVEIIELHGLSDASLKAYAAIIYIRFKLKDASYCVNFVANKTKINPTERKNLTIPKTWNFFVGLTHNCLFCIHNTKKNWKQFIQTRVLKIRHLASRLFCPGVQNPADIPTRASYLKDDDIKEFWLEGPAFLPLSQEDWPSTKNFENYKSHESHYLAELSNPDIDTGMKNIFSFEKYNSFEKLIRITSFVLRFIDNIKLKVENKTFMVVNLVLDEINRAKRLLINNEQRLFE